MQVDLQTLRTFCACAPFVVDLGVVPVAVGEGQVSTSLAIRWRSRRAICSTPGQAHAGVMATMADHSTGAAAKTLAAEGFWVRTAELKTSLLRAGKGALLRCKAGVIKPGRMIAFTEAEVLAEAADGQRTLVMKASATLAPSPARR